MALVPQETTGGYTLTVYPLGDLNNRNTLLYVSSIIQITNKIRLQLLDVIWYWY